MRRVVFLIETKNEKDINALETVGLLFATKTKDFITAVDEKNIILVKRNKAGRGVRGSGKDRQYAFRYAEHRGYDKSAHSVWHYCQ